MPVKPQKTFVRSLRVILAQLTLQHAITGLMPQNKPAIGSLFLQPNNIRRPSVDTEKYAIMKYTQWK